MVYKSSRITIRKKNISTSLNWLTFNVPITKTKRLKESLDGTNFVDPCSDKCLLFSIM